MKYYLPTLLIALSVIVAVPSSNAANRPVSHWGTFRKVATLNTCISCALSAVSRQGYQVFLKDNNTVIAGNNQVVVQVSCSPQRDGTTWVVVTAHSSDSATAESARNTVRQKIVNCGAID